MKTKSIKDLCLESVVNQLLAELHNASARIRSARSNNMMQATTEYFQRDLRVSAARIRYILPREAAARKYFHKLLKSRSPGMRRAADGVMRTVFKAA